MTTLKDAQKDPKKLEQFIKEHEQTSPADKEKFDKALTSMTCGKKKSEQETSGQDSSES